MKGKFTLLYFLSLILVMGLLVGFISTMSGDPNADTAPVTENTPGTGFEADTIRPLTFPYPTGFNWNYTAINGVNSGTVGATYNSDKWILNKWNTPNTWYRWNNNGPSGGPGTPSDSTTYPGAVRDLTNGPGGFVYGGSATNVLRRINPATGATMASFTIPGAIFRAVAYDPNRKGFWNSDFGGNITCYDTAGVLKGTITTIATAKYGLAFDSTSTADSAFLWVWNQGPGATGTQTQNELYKYHVASGTLKATYIFGLYLTGAGIAGGAECNIVNNKFMLCLNWQNQAVTGYVLKDLTPPSSSNTLVIYNDSVGTTAQRTADRDTLRKYVPMLVGNVTYMTKNTTTVFPDLSGYSTIIFQETSFDAVAVRSLTALQRQAIKDWLATGTPSAKKSLIMIGGDMGYAYDRTGATDLDTVLSRSYGGYQYMLDNGAANATLAAVGTGSTYDLLSTTPPGGSYWPDGCKPISGGQMFNLYRTRIDTVASISKTGTGWNVITTFQDPRYYTGAGDGTGDLGFKRVLKNMVAWVKSNGGLITGVEPIGSQIVNDYKLSQNYPNPFNPTTKINFSIPKSGLTTLKVYDILGKEVATLINGFQNAGNYVVDFNASNLASGAYFYRLEVNGFVNTKKMLLIK